MQARNIIYFIATCFFATYAKAESNQIDYSKNCDMVGNGFCVFTEIIAYCDTLINNKVTTPVASEGGTFKKSLIQDKTSFNTSSQANLATNIIPVNNVKICIYRDKCGDSKEITATGTFTTEKSGNISSNHEQVWLSQLFDNEHWPMENVHENQDEIKLRTGSKSRKMHYVATYNKKSGQLDLAQFAMVFEQNSFWDWMDPHTVKNFDLKYHFIAKCHILNKSINR